jgi:hypothetical protein
MRPSRHHLQDADAECGDLSPSEASAKLLPLPENGPYGPADRDRPALHEGAPAAIGHHTTDKSREVSTEVR